MLADIILQAQAGNDEAKLLLIRKFNPLLHKYAYKLNYDDAYNDLVADFLELIQKIDISSLRSHCDGSIISYICKSVYGKYLNKSKAFFRSPRAIPFSALSKGEERQAETLLSSSDDYDILLTHGLGSILNKHEMYVLYTIYFSGYSSADIARLNHTSRQSVNQTKGRALKKLRNTLVTHPRKECV